MVKKNAKKETPQVSDDVPENLIADSFIKPGEEDKGAVVLKKVKEEIPIDKHIKWYTDEYLKQIEFNKLPRLKQAKTDISNGPLLRMQNISLMKYLYSYNTMDMIVVVMKLYDSISKKETNYGTLFCEIIKPEQARNHYDVFRNVAFTYYSASPSYISCDGEYRSQFSRYHMLSQTKRNYSEIWNELEQYVTRITVRRQWSTYPNYFYPKIEQYEKNSEIEFAVKNEMIPMTILTVAWFSAIYDYMTGMTRTHVNQTYKDIFLNEADADVAFIKELIKKYGSDKIELFKASLNDIQTNFQGTRKYLQCGYKMIPLNMKEVQDPLRLRYKPWKEYFISNRCNDLIINSIAPGFSIILDWFYIKNSKKGLFDNKSQYDRMKNSEIAKDILRILYEAQRGTYFASENLEGILKNQKSIKSWLTPKFKKLYDKIDDPINYSIEEIIMSEVTLAFANEYVGRTFADCITLVGTSKIFDSYLGHPFKDSGYDYFAKYMFEICYNLFCVNSRLGLIHGDFHLNNATIGSIYNPGKDFVANKDKTNKVVYVIDDEFQFVFPNNSYFGCLIDFSRGIINPHTYDIFIDKGLPSNYQPVKDVDKFVASEINTLLTLYVQLFPNKQKQRDELVVLFKNHFDAVFKLMTCIDIFMFSIRMSRILGTSTYPVGKKCLELVVKINKLAELYITREMNYLIDDPVGHSKKVLAEDFPILTIMKKCFPEYIDGGVFKDIGVITDVYCYQNLLTHSLANYELFPDFLKYVKYLDDSGKLIEVPQVTQKRIDLRRAQEKMKTRNLDMMSFIAMRHGKKAV